MFQLLVKQVFEVLNSELQFNVTTQVYRKYIY